MNETNWKTRMRRAFSSRAAWGMSGTAFVGLAVGSLFPDMVALEEITRRCATSATHHNTNASWQRNRIISPSENKFVNQETAKHQELYTSAEVLVSMLTSEYGL